MENKDFYFNDKIDVTLERYFETYGVTVDTFDYVPGKHVHKIHKFIFKNLKREFKYIRKDTKRHVKTVKRAELRELKKKKLAEFKAGIKKLFKRRNVVSD